MDFKDYYKTLSVEPDADSKTIKTAYRKLARKYHPDVSQDHQAEDKFKEVSEAYEVLKDPQKRAEYDEIRRYGGQQSAPGWRQSEIITAPNYLHLRRRQERVKKLGRRCGFVPPHKLVSLAHLRSIATV